MADTFEKIDDINFKLTQTVETVVSTDVLKFRLTALQAEKTRIENDITDVTNQLAQAQAIGVG